MAINIYIYIYLYVHIIHVDSTDIHKLSMFPQTQLTSLIPPPKKTEPPGGGRGTVPPPERRNCSSSWARKPAGTPEEKENHIQNVPWYWIC